MPDDPPLTPKAGEGGHKGGGERFVAHANLMSVLTVISRVFGLLRDKACSIYLGNTTPQWGAFWMGFQLPNLFRRIFGEGALTAIFVPVYTRVLEKEGKGQANRLASTVSTLLVVVLGSITLVGEAVLIPLTLSSQMTPENRLATAMIAIMLPYCVMVCLVALFSAMATVHERFAAQAISPIILNVFMTLAAVLPVWLWTATLPLEQRIVWVAGAVVVAGMVQVLQMLPTLRRSGIELSGMLKVNDPAIREIIRSMLPMMVGLSAVQLNTYMDTQIAWWFSPDGHDKLNHFALLGWQFRTPMESGAVGVLSVAQRLYMLPVGIFGVSMATAIFPQMAKAVTRNDQGELRRLLVSGLGKTLFISIPASVGMILVARGLITVIYSGDGLDRSTNAAMWFCAGIWAFEAQMVILRMYYAMSDRMTPMKVAVSMVGLNFTLNLGLVWFLQEGGIALSTTFCAALQCVILLAILRKRLGRLGLGALVKPVGKSLLAAGVMVLVALGVSYLLKQHLHLPLEVSHEATGQNGRRGWELLQVSLISLPLIVGASAVSYLGMAWVLKMPELGHVPLLGRWLKKLVAQPNQ